MSVLKGVFLAATTLLFFSVSVLISSYIYFETNWFRSDFILQCDGDRHGVSFALVVETDTGRVLFEGRQNEEEETERELVRFTDTQIGMKWALDDGKTAKLWISRVNNKMRMWRELENGERDEELEEVNGTCRVKSRSF